MDISEEIVNFKFSLDEFEGNSLDMQKRTTKYVKENLEVLFNSLEDKTPKAQKYYTLLKEACLVYDKQKPSFGFHPDKSKIFSFASTFLLEVENLRFNKIKVPVNKENCIELNLSNYLYDKELIDSCKTSFDSGKHWDACGLACRHLEERIRKKAGISPGTVGVELIGICFGKNGKLKIPCCETEEEEEGFKLLNLGIVKFHRNAKMHREGKINKELAIKVIGYIDYLISILETAKIRD